jgi:hypothetical protein
MRDFKEKTELDHVKEYSATKKLLKKWRVIKKSNNLTPENALFLVLIYEF